MAYPHSTYTTGRALTYSYIHIAPQLPNTRYILFLHGFPSTSHHWRHQIAFFAAKGYGILAPDLLGFGQTSKPSELDMYRGESMARDIVEILEFEGVEVVVGVAHDWYVLEPLLSFWLLSHSGAVKWREGGSEGVSDSRAIVLMRRPPLGDLSFCHAWQIIIPSAFRPMPSSTSDTMPLAVASPPRRYTILTAP